MWIKNEAQTSSEGNILLLTHWLNAWAEWKRKGSRKSSQAGCIVVLAIYNTSYLYVAIRQQHSNTFAVLLLFVLDSFVQRTILYCVPFLIVQPHLLCNHDIMTVAIIIQSKEVMYTLRPTLLQLASWCRCCDVPYLLAWYLYFFKANYNDITFIPWCNSEINKTRRFQYYIL